MAPKQVVKTLVVRRGEDDYLFILVRGDRQISWPKLRALLGVTRLSMPNAETARDATGYERGTITPFGATAGVARHHRRPGQTDHLHRGGSTRCERLGRRSRRDRDPVGDRRRRHGTTSTRRRLNL